MENIDTLIRVIKEQAEIFLLDAWKFFPFGTYISNENEIVPLGPYIEDVNNRPESQPLIDMLERGIRTRLDKGKCVIGALAIDILLTENQQKFDAILVRIFESNDVSEKIFKYYIHENYVEFV